MNRVTPRRLFLVGAALAVTPQFVQAHGSHDQIQGLIAGCAHPFTGWDHLLAMAAVGIWAAQLGGAARWLVPVAFMGTAAFGAVVGGPWLLPALTEPMILTSLLVLGLLIATAIRLPVAASAALVAGFAFFHGAGHFAAQPHGNGTLSAALGLLLASGFVHAVGFAAGMKAERSSTFITRLLGAAVAMTGLAFL